MPKNVLILICNPIILVLYHPLGKISRKEAKACGL